MGKTIFINNLFRFILLFDVCWGAMAWFTWEIDANFQYALAIESLFLIASFLYAKENKVETMRGKHIKLLAFLFVCLMIYRSRFNIVSIIRMIMRYSPIMVALCDYNNSRANLTYISKGIAIILVPGLILHFVMLYTGIFPSVIIQRGEWVSYVFFNYFVLLKGASFYEASGLRFQSVFLEPGYCGTLLSFLLYSNKFDLKKKYNIIILIGLLASLSLAGYVTTMVGYIAYNYSKNINIKRYVYILLAFFVGYYFAINYNNGDNPINKEIVERLQPDDEKGISGNNRVSDATDEYFAQILKSGEFLFGVGQTEVDSLNGGRFTGENSGDSIAGAGYKMFIILDGLILALLWMLFYYKLTNLNPNKRYAWGYFIIIVLTFLQCSYPYSSSWLIPVVLAVKSDEDLYLS